jgi:hypothetical protein
MNWDEFVASVADDAAALKTGRAPAGLVSCEECDVPLQETITGCRPYTDGTFACSDCYFRAIGRELEDAPLYSRRTMRGG